MKLYYSPGACSLAPHIVARELDLPLELVRVHLDTHRTESGEDYFQINPHGYVPTLEADGERLTEAAALVQYLAERTPSSPLLPPSGSKERAHVNQWLAFISTEVHKAISPWLFSDKTADSTRQGIHDKLARRFGELDALFATQDYLTGSGFTVADAYAFTIVNWTNFVGIDLKPYPHLSTYMARVAARPKVKEALEAEGLTASGEKQ